MPVTKASMIEQFIKIYGGSPEGVEVFFAPGQVNFIGDHTDYNGGHVLPCALTLGTYVAVRKRDDDFFRFASSKFPEEAPQKFTLREQRPLPFGNWVNYPLGAVWSLIAHGCRPGTGFDMYFHGTLPMNRGLSSSASIIMATIYSLTQMFPFPNITPVDLVLMGQDAEASFLDVGIGIMGPFMAVFGKKDHAVFLKTSSMHYRYTPLELLDKRIIITDSGVKHANLQKVLGECNADCREGMRFLSENINIRTLCDVTSDQFETYKDLIPFENIRKRVRHVVYENQRVMQAYNSLNVGNIARFGKLMNESHISLRDDYGASCPEVDCLVEAAWETPGVIGSRITGVGFGGCTVSIVENDSIQTFIEHVSRTYREQTGREAAFIVADIGDGAHRVEE